MTTTTMREALEREQREWSPGRAVVPIGNCRICGCETAGRDATSGAPRCEVCRVNLVLDEMASPGGPR